MREIYKELEIIKENENKRIVLVRNMIDNLLYLKKEYSSNSNIYNQIKELNSDYFPKISRIYNEEDKMIVIEEYFNCPTLDIVLLNKKISNKEKINIFIEIAKAIELLHESNPPIIHRDIKPENIFYNNGKIIVFDFDISRNYQVLKNSDTTILGSVGYAAPEQFGFSQSDQRSDIYALGVLFNFIMTGKLLTEEIYQGYEKKIIVKATYINPKQRYQSVREMLEDIDSGPFKPLKSMKKKIVLYAGMVLLGLLCFNVPFEVDNVLLTGMPLRMYQASIFLMFVIIFMVCGNYYSIRRVFLLNNSNYLIIRIIGIVVSVVVSVFLEIIFIGVIAQIM